MSIAATIRGVLETKQADRKSDAQATWDKLVAKVHNSGNRSELNEKEVDQLHDAAESLGIVDYPEQFASDIEVLEQRDRDVKNRSLREKMLREFDAAQLSAVEALIGLVDAHNRVLVADRKAAAVASSNGDLTPLASLGLQVAYQGNVTGLPQLAARAKTILDSKAEEIHRRFNIGSDKWRIENE
jgi:hypothetical protein